MSYMLLIVEPVGQRRERGEAAGRDAYARMERFGAELQAQGLLLGANALAGAGDAVRLSRAGGKRTLVDGPYAEAKELIGGYFLLDCATREQALEIAARCPAAEWCSVEVRRVAPCWEPER